MKTRGHFLVSRRQVLEGLAAVVVLATLPLGRFDGLAQGADRKPKIGIIGSGRVGSNLGRAWANAGYEILFSSRDLEADRKLAAQVGKGARAGTPQEAVAFGDILLFAVPYTALPDLGATLGASLKGKVVIDACNPLPARDGAMADVARAKGAGLATAEFLPGARIVRAFNAIPAARMGAMHDTPGVVGMPIAGDDRQAMEIASSVIKAIGFEPVLIGGLTMGQFLMPGTPLAGEHSPDEIRRIMGTLKP